VHHSRGGPFNRHRRRASGVTLIAAAVLVGLSACSTSTVSASGSSPPQGAPSSGSAAPHLSDVAENLAMPGQVQHQLVAAAAAAKHVPAWDFVGLDPHTRYYAYDYTTGTYWASATLVPRSSATAAEVSVQDNGSSDLFEKSTGGRWHAFEVGTAGTGGTRCPVDVPAAVAVRWGWPGPGCRPQQQP
jgi:hypothetical protein